MIRMDKQPNDAQIYEFSRNLEIIAKQDNDTSLKEWMKASKYFLECTEKQYDISLAIPYLLNISSNVSHISIKENIGETIIKHALNIKNNQIIKKVLNEQKFTDFFLRPLIKYISKDIYIEDVILEIALQFPKIEFLTIEFFIKYLNSNTGIMQDRLAKIIEIMQQNESLKSYLPRFLEKVSLSGIDISKQKIL